MAISASAHDLRNMLSVAAKLRLLAGETTNQADRELYRVAADALEKRAAWLSGALPEAHHEPAPPPMPNLHRPVNLIV